MIGAEDLSLGPAMPCTELFMKPDVLEKKKMGSMLAPKAASKEAFR